MSCSQPLPLCAPQPPLSGRMGDAGRELPVCRPLGPVDTSRVLGKAKQVQFLLQSLQSLPPLLALVMAERRGVLPALLQLRARPCCR